jgi:hypothetical protein
MSQRFLAKFFPAYDAEVSCGIFLENLSHCPISSQYSFSQGAEIGLQEVDFACI